MIIPLNHEPVLLMHNKQTYALQQMLIHSSEIIVLYIMTYTTCRRHIFASDLLALMLRLSNNTN